MSFNAESYLMHHGILGQKWYRRRWQNEDGSLTPAGRIHYGVGAPRDPAAKEAKKAERAAAKEAKRQARTERKEEKKEEQRQKNIASGNLKEILKHPELYSTEEINEARDRSMLLKTTGLEGPDTKKINSENIKYIDRNTGLFSNDELEYAINREALKSKIKDLRNEEYQGFMVGTANLLDKAAMLGTSMVKLKEVYDKLNGADNDDSRLTKLKKKLELKQVVKSIKDLDKPEDEMAKLKKEYDLKKLKKDIDDLGKPKEEDEMTKLKKEYDLKKLKKDIDDLGKPASKKAEVFDKAIDSVFGDRIKEALKKNGSGASNEELQSIYEDYMSAKGSYNAPKSNKSSEGSKSSDLEGFMKSLLNDTSSEKKSTTPANNTSSTPEKPASKPEDNGNDEKERAGLAVFKQASKWASQIAKAEANEERAKELAGSEVFKQANRLANQIAYEQSVNKNVETARYNAEKETSAAREAAKSTKLSSLSNSNDDAVARLKEANSKLFDISIERLKDDK